MMGICSSSAAGIGGANSGESYVVFGQAASLGPIVQLAGLDGADGFTLEGAATGDQTGTTVNEAGDFNGDGIDDFLVTAPNANRTATTDGAVFVVFGGAAFAATANIDQLDGTDGFRLTGLDNFESIGSGAPSFGDVNGDGLADIIIGAPQADVVGGDSGAAYVVFGTTSPLAASQSVSFLDGADGFRVTGTISGDNLGRATGAGDINGDGFDDIIVSVPNREDGLTDQGVTAVIFGKANGFSADQNINALNGADGFRINGVSAGDLSGFAATAAGDVNADGFEDILLASGQANGGAGEGYIIFGSATFGAEIELSALDATQGSIITGGQGWRPSGPLCQRHRRPGW